jgi:hypothetical protein
MDDRRFDAVFLHHHLDVLVSRGMLLASRGKDRKR